MKKRFPWGCVVMIAVGLLAGGGGVWWWFGHKAASDEAEKEPAPTAQVQVAPLRRGQIERTLTAYGTAVAAPGGVRSVAFPFECRVVAVTANVGQTVAAGDAVLQIEPSADARLALDTAQSAQEAAEKTLRDVQARFQAHLATNSDLQSAQSALRDAQLKFQSLRGRSPGTDGVVKAPAAGLITRLPAAPGTVVPAGGPLVELAVENRFEARLGIAPADAAEVKAAQSVHLFAVQARGDVKEAAAEGSVRVVGGSVDPATRMVDAFVALNESADGAAPILIGAYLRAEIVLEKRDGLLALRAAVLPTEGDQAGGVVFTVKGDHAVKHEVETGIDDGTNVELINGSDVLKEGTNVVTVGNYELEDKMAVEVGHQDEAKKDDEAGKEEAAAPAPLGQGKDPQDTKANKASADVPKDDHGDAHQKEEKTP